MDNDKSFKAEQKFRLVLWIVFAIVMVFFSGHLSGALQEESYNGLLHIFDRIKERPLDCFYFNQYVFGFGALCFLSVFFMTFFKINKPKGEMKGIEHGSARFMTADDIKKFLKSCSSTVLPYDFVEPEFDVPKEETEEEFKEKLRKITEEKKQIELKKER